MAVVRHRNATAAQLRRDAQHKRLHEQFEHLDVLTRFLMVAIVVFALVWMARIFLAIINKMLSGLVSKRFEMF